MVILYSVLVRSEIKSYMLDYPFVYLEWGRWEKRRIFIALLRNWSKPDKFHRFKRQVFAEMIFHLQKELSFLFNLN